MTIDWIFLGSLEGANIAHGYVPDPEGSSSGVTIATGIDLGQISPTLVESLSTDIRDAIQPYVGLRKNDAVDALKLRPLVLTNAQCDALNQAVRAPIVANLSQHYRHDAGVAFEAIPDAAQTVCASVAYQYGAIWQRTPKFWEYLCRQDWKATIAELRAFGDAYPTRRRTEANYLAKALGLPQEPV
jgi:hypothetical protein